MVRPARAAARASESKLSLGCSVPGIPPALPVAQRCGRGAGRREMLQLGVGGSTPGMRREPGQGGSGNGRMWGTGSSRLPAGTAEPVHTGLEKNHPQQTDAFGMHHRGSTPRVGLLLALGFLGRERLPRGCWRRPARGPCAVGFGLLGEARGVRPDCLSSHAALRSSSVFFQCLQ